MKERVRVTKEDIKVGLLCLGLKKGDVVGVHSSLSRFGCVEGDADAVIDAILETVGEEGTVVMPTYSTNLAKVERSPEEIAIGVLWIYKVLPYVANDTSCSTGLIPETFRKRKAALRSTHRVFSLAAIGPKAKEIIEAGSKDSLASWKKLLELEGYILLMGVGLENCTAMHLAEERVRFPKHISDKLTPPRWFVEKYPQTEWEWDFGPYPDFAKMDEPCLRQGIMKSVIIGEARVTLLRLKESVDLYTEYLTRDPDIFYGGSST